MKNEIMLLNVMLGAVRSVRAGAKNQELARLALEEELTLVKRLRRAMASEEAPHAEMALQPA